MHAHRLASDQLTRALLMAAAVACGGGRDDGNGGSGPDAGRSDGRARIVASATPAPTAECRVAADCVAGPGAAPGCAALGPYAVCVDESPVALEPSAAADADECDAERPCATGECYLATLFPSGQCGLGGASLQNSCRVDACASDADCGGGVCGPPGLTSDGAREGGFVRQCFEAHCLSDADCTARSGGFCGLVQGWCALEPGAGVQRDFEPARLACIYPGGCTRSAACPGSASCEVVGGAGVCVARD